MITALFIYTHRTFSEINEPGELEEKCLELCECLAEDLEKHNLKVCSIFTVASILSYIIIVVW